MKQTEYKKTCSTHGESAAAVRNGRKHEKDTNAVEVCRRSCAGDWFTADADV